jgi:SAM-dependent methyltransferase
VTGECDATGHPAELTEYYAALGETDRLSRTSIGRLEYLRTRELLDRVLPDTGTVLDVGGGTGVHAAWIASQHRPVHVIDPIPAHVSAAAAHPWVTAAAGDARRLSWPDSSAAAVLLLGPLYHLADRPDRVQALREAVRVVRPGGVVAAAAIARHASLFDFAARGLLTAERLTRIQGTLRSGRHDPTLGFTDAWFHCIDDLGPELVEAGLGEVTVAGIEGPAYLILKAAEAAGEVSDELFASALTLARVTETDPDVLAVGSHLLATGRRPPAPRTDRHAADPKSARSATGA